MHHHHAVHQTMKAFSINFYRHPIPIFFDFGIVMRNSTAKIVVPIPISDLALNLFYDQLVMGDLFLQRQFFGHDGEYTAELTLQHQLCVEFWKLEQENVHAVLTGWHSEPLSNFTNMNRAIRAYLQYLNPFEEDLVQRLGLTDTDITDIARAAMELIERELPALYSNPLFTLNAFSIPLFILVNETFPSLVMLGDGILDYFASLGLGEVTNDVVHSHEFAHILQSIIVFENSGHDIDRFVDLMFNVTGTESRKIELKADASATYFLAHERGRNFEVPLLSQASRASFAIGDCNVQSEEHHGAPPQRQCATLWGADFKI
jgi:hypothetical protein